MLYKRRSQQLQAAKAREGRALKRLQIDSNLDTDGESSEVEVTSWAGGVNNHLIGFDESDSNFGDTEWESEESDDEVDELEGADLVESLRKELKNELNLLKQAAQTPYEKISNANLTARDWKKAEQN
jgi:hypothetical protein